MTFMIDFVTFGGGGSGGSILVTFLIDLVIFGGQGVNFGEL